MTYRVEFTEIYALSTEIETRCDDMLERLEEIKTAVNGLIDNPDLQGQYAIALKELFGHSYYFINNRRKNSDYP